jgi:hypothetical protein
MKKEELRVQEEKSLRLEKKLCMNSIIFFFIFKNKNFFLFI